MLSGLSASPMMSRAASQWRATLFPTVSGHKPWNRVVRLDTSFGNLARLQENGCLLWIGNIDPQGWPRYYVPKTERVGLQLPSHGYVPAHRWSLELYLGRKIKPGYIVRPTCGNRTCVRPSHLEEVTRYLSESRVIEIRELVAAGNSVTLVAEKYGMSKANVSEIVRGKKYRHFGGPLTSGRGTETHCRNGHRWSENSSLVDEYSPIRRCLACGRDRARKKRSSVWTS